MRYSAMCSAVVASLVIAAPIASAHSYRADRASVAVVVLLVDAPGGEDRTVVGVRAAQIVGEVGGRLGSVWAAGIHGFAARVPLNSIPLLRQDPRIATVEPDVAMHVSTMANPPWGLDRIDQPKLPLDHHFQPTETGSGVTAYVIDTGIRATHSDFGDRVRTGVDLVDGGAADDCHGHGTHVAGVIGGARHGVAPRVQLVAVRVMDCAGAGSASAVISGIEWVTANHEPGAPAVANLSLGGPPSVVLDEALRRSIESGVTYAVAAGNGTREGRPEDACGSSPARVREAITVSATDKEDQRAPWAGFGSCVDLFAPGVSITSTWSTSDDATKSLSGTSMAAPHVAGAAAIYLTDHPNASPAEVAAALRKAASADVVGKAMTRNPRLVQVET